MKRKKQQNVHIQYLLHLHLSEHAHSQYPQTVFDEEEEELTAPQEERRLHDKRVTLIEAGVPLLREINANEKIEFENRCVESLTYCSGATVGELQKERLRGPRCDGHRSTTQPLVTTGVTSEAKQDELDPDSITVSIKQPLVSVPFRCRHECLVGILVIIEIMNSQSVSITH